MNAVNPPLVLIRALRRILQPLVRLMLASGITYPFLTELLKGVFVEVAQKDFRLDDKPPSDSRITLLTGVHRKDVRRLREAGPDGALALPEQMSFGAQLVAAWLGQAPFVDGDGHARPLPRLAHAGNVSFEDLVSSQSKDIRARVVLDEWLRLGVVRLDEADRVVLNTEAFVPQAGLDEKLYFFAHNLHDHAAAAAANLNSGTPPWLERCVFYDALSAPNIDALHDQARRMGSDLLKGLSSSAQTMEEQNAQNPEVKQRFTCGVYFYSEPVEKKGVA